MENMQLRIYIFHSDLFITLRCTAGGTISVVGKHSVKADDLPMEYLLAHFGTKVRTVRTVCYEYVLCVLQVVVILLCIPVWVIVLFQYFGGETEAIFFTLAVQTYH